MKAKNDNIILIAILLLISISISIFNPLGGNLITDEIKTILSFVSFLFAILSGFFIASLWDRFTKIRSLISAETANLENIYKFVELAGKSLAKKFADKIDKYIIKSLEFELHNYQEKLKEEYFALYKPLIDLRNKKMDVPLTRVLNIFDQFTTHRKEILSRGKDKLGAYHWIALILLAFSLILIWIYIQIPGTFGVIMGSILTFTILIVLVIIYDLNNLKWGSEQINIEVYERVYDVIGLKRYYPEELLNKVTIPKEIKEYRVGVLINHKTYQRKIKIVKNRNI